MKQRISTEQLDELSPVEKAKIAKWENGSSIHLTIGQMIAYIDEHVKSGWWTIERSGDKTAWRTMGKYAGLDGNQEEAELCDVLWHQVKLLLREEQ